MYVYILKMYAHTYISPLIVCNIEHKYQKNKEKGEKSSVKEREKDKLLQCRHYYKNEKKISAKEGNKQKKKGRKKEGKRERERKDEQRML